MSNKKERVFVIIDGSALFHRAYFALPKLKTKNDFVINAVYGFLLSLFKIIKDFKPHFLAVCLDSPKPTFRHELFKEYKATRPKMPEELKQQIPLLKKVLSLLEIKTIEKPGFEADDIILALANKAKEATNVETIIFSNDLDVFQVINKKTKVFAFKKGIKNGILYDEERFLNTYHLFPFQIPDFKALVGDPSDNLPGVPGIGKKTAVKLLASFKTVEALIKKAEKQNKKNNLPPKMVQILKEYKKQILNTKKLAKLKAGFLKNISLSYFSLKEYNKEKAQKKFKEWGFKSLSERLPTLNSRKQKTLFEI